MVTQFNCLREIGISSVGVIGCNGYDALEIYQFLIVRVINGFGNDSGFILAPAQKQVVGLCNEYVRVRRMQAKAVFYGGIRFVRLTGQGLVLGDIGYVHAVKIDRAAFSQHVLI